MATGRCFVNIDEAVLEWAWQQYDVTASRRQKRLRRKHDRGDHLNYLRTTIDWSDVRCVKAPPGEYEGMLRAAAAMRAVATITLAST